MKLKQLRYIQQIVNNEFNVSATAKKMFTSQSAVSKQVLLFEEEMGTNVFIRNGKHLTGLSLEGKAIFKIANDILERVDELNKFTKELKDNY